MTAECGISHKDTNVQSMQCIQNFYSENTINILQYIQHYGSHLHQKNTSVKGVCMSISS